MEDWLWQLVEDKSIAEGLFGNTMRAAGQSATENRHEEGVLALAIDPLFAPGLLTVESQEYQYGRVDAAMDLFMTLVTLPQEPELAEIIEKAGGFLLECDDFANALRLYRAAADASPDVAEFWSGISYSLARLGAKQEAIEPARKAAACAPDDSHQLSDLGWTLMEAGHFVEARTVLQKAVARAPASYATPKNNLIELEKQMRNNDF